MTSGRGHHYLLVLGFLGIIGAVAPFQAASEIRQGEAPQVLDLFRQLPTVAALRSYEKDLEDGAMVANAVRPHMQYLRYRAFGDTGEQALVGRNGWWFYRPDVRFLTERCPDHSAAKTGPRAAVSAIVSFRDQLAARGIRLLVIPMPGKPSIYPNMLTRRAVVCDPRVREHTRKVMTGLAATGVETIDLFEAFAQANATSRPSDSASWYLERDTHWTNGGARFAAGVVARKVRSLGLAPAGSVGYETKPVVVHRPGDVLRMLRSPMIEALFSPEAVPCEQVVRRDNGTPYRDDPASPILVLGDSFLRIYERDEPGSAGFIAHLARELSQPLASIVNDGGASTLVRQALADKPALLKHKKLVIWEFVERDIRFGMEGWKEVPLPEVASTAPGSPTTARVGS